MTEAELIEQLPLLTDRWDIRNWLYEVTWVGLTPGLVAAVAAQAERTAASGEAGRAGMWMAWELVWKLGDAEERAEAERRMRLLG